MRLKLCRCGNIFNPSFIILPVILIVISSLFSVLNNFRWNSIISGIAVVLIYMLISPLNYPKYIQLKAGEINYIEPISLMSKYGIGRKSIKVKYYITDITKFKLEQNKIERLFGMAHIIFEGQTTFDAGKHTERISPRNTHRVYGISIKKHKQVISDFVSSLNLFNK